eukprot:c39577_g1_i1 orf=291-1427(+)
MSEHGSQDSAAEGKSRVVEDPAWLATMEVASLCCVPMALKAAINLDVFDILSRAGMGSQLSAGEIVAELLLSNPNAALSLDRVLRVLACHSILSSSAVPINSGIVVRKYGLNWKSKYLVKNKEGFSLAPIVLMNQDKVFMDAWHYLQDSVVEGEEPFTKAHGKDSFSYGQEDLRFDKLFNLAMSSHTKLLMQTLLEVYDSFSNIHTLVDVGGGTGSCLHMIISKHTHIRGINFDQPHVVEAAPAYPGIEHIGGDMFESVPSADAIFMKWILHDWGDEQCIKLLGNCCGALPANGKVIVVDTVLPIAVETGITARVAYQHDLLMLAYNQGGRERSEEEMQKLAEAGGFGGGMAVVGKVNEVSVMEFYKTPPSSLLPTST